MYRKILVAVDGSSYSQKALETSRELALKTDPEVVIVVHIIENTALGVHASPDIHQRLFAEGHKLLESSAKVLEQDGIKAATVIKHDDAAKAIVSLAIENDVDLIVIGSRGLGRFGGLMLGSVSDKVLHFARCSVLVAR